MEAQGYIAYLLSEPAKSSCVRSGAVLQISHDEVNRFLANSDVSGKDLFDKAKGAFQLQGGVASVDDRVIDKRLTVIRLLPGWWISFGAGCITGASKSLTLFC